MYKNLLDSVVSAGNQYRNGKFSVSMSLFSGGYFLILARDFHRHMVALAASSFNKKRSLLDRALEDGWQLVNCNSIRYGNGPSIEDLPIKHGPFPLVEIIRPKAECGQVENRCSERFRFARLLGILSDWQLFAFFSWSKSES